VCLRLDHRCGVFRPQLRMCGRFCEHYLYLGTNIFLLRGGISPVLIPKLISSSFASCVARDAKIQKMTMRISFVEYSRSFNTFLVFDRKFHFVSRTRISFILETIGTDGIYPKIDMKPCCVVHFPHSRAHIYAKWDPSWESATDYQALHWHLLYHDRKVLSQHSPSVRILHHGAFLERGRNAASWTVC